MARYIDADKLMEECKNHTMDEVYPEWNDKKVFDALCQMGHMFKKIIDETPTADVEEVKCGEWKDRYNNKYYNHLYECSVCGKEALYECYKNELDQWKERQALTPICPYCSAKMDKENAQ